MTALLQVLELKGVKKFKEVKKLKASKKLGKLNPKVLQLNIQTKNH